MFLVFNACRYIDRKSHGNAAPVYDESHNLAKYAIPFKASIGRGDCLYLPVYWYHSVFSSAGRTVSINYWRMPKHEKMLDLEGLFCGHSSQSRAKCH